MALSKTYQTGATAKEKHSVLYQLAFNSNSPTGLFRDSEGFKSLKAESYTIQKQRALEMSVSKLSLIEILDK